MQYTDVTLRKPWGFFSDKNNNSLDLLNGQTNSFKEYYLEHHSVHLFGYTLGFKF